MYNNLISKPGTIHAARKYYSSFERERSLSNFACTVRQPSSFTSQTGSNGLDFAFQFQYRYSRSRGKNCKM
ncbi:hypothetical protein ALC62_00641 [Cyphomyrmex costatus]|uniref:Uncharacterized protein n=1 Tax=Cyphomyrmex costatus TaxID=456900 RepID=A0A151IQF6_9HYME|nr:hypothetical protein ALC62_00641 [Cyphomyrmex costatus]